MEKTCSECGKGVSRPTPKAKFFIHCGVKQPFETEENLTDTPPVKDSASTNVEITDVKLSDAKLKTLETEAETYSCGKCKQITTTTDKCSNCGVEFNDI